MSDNQALWRAGDKEPPRDLRPPRGLLREKPNQQSSTAEPQPSQPKSEDVKTKTPSTPSGQSTLNPEASEWYPQSIPIRNVDGLTRSINDRLKIHKMPEAPNETSNAEMVSNVHDIVAGHKDSDMKRLKHLINTLNMDPGQFDNLLEIIMETLCPYLQDIVTVSVIAQLLVNEAVTNPNFRYTAAKLCWCIEQNCAEFRAELPLRCQKQLEDVSNLQNTCLFIAELYMQLPHSQVYGTKLIDSYNKLLGKGAVDDIKCICQALKLTGYSLEKTNKSDLDLVIKQLEGAKNKMNGSVLSLLKSVLQLRQTNWGHTDEPNDTEEHEGYFYEAGQNTIIYQTDGNNLTHEESEFIAAHQHASEEYLGDGFDPDELCDPEPEMDAEIQEAFKEFVKYSSKQ